MYVKLPNQSIALVYEKGLIKTTVQVSLKELIANDLEGVLDILSERVTGTDLLTDIQYSIKCFSGDSISLEVIGCIDFVDFEEVSEINLPEQRWTVSICRMGFGFSEVEILAKTEEEAINAADALAGDLEYSEKSSEYAFEVSPTPDVSDYCGQVCGGGQCGNGKVCQNGIDTETHLPTTEAPQKVLIVASDTCWPMEYVADGLLHNDGTVEQTSDFHNESGAKSSDAGEDDAIDIHSIRMPDGVERRISPSTMKLLPESN